MVLKWFVVSFSYDNSVEVVPSSWVVDNDCFWPSTTKIKCYKYIRDRTEPLDDWKIYKIIILGKYEEYSVAQKKCDKARYKDNLTTSEAEDPKLGKGYRFKKHKKYVGYDSTDSDNNEVMDSDLPQFPTEVTDMDHQSMEYRSTKRQSVERGVLTAVDSNQTQTPTQSNVQKKVTTTSNFVGNNDKENNLSSISKDLAFIKLFVSEHKEFERQVLRQLHLMGCRMRDMADDFEILKKSIGKDTAQEPIQVVDEDLVNLMKLLPITDHSVFLNFQRTVDEHESYSKAISKELSQIGGSTVKEITKNIISVVLTNEVGLLYSWEGAKGKKIFKTTTLAKIIISAVRLNKSTKDATDHEIIKIIKDWLVRAKFRIKKQETDTITEHGEQKTVEENVAEVTE